MWHKICEWNSSHSILFAKMGSDGCSNCYSYRIEILGQKLFAPNISTQEVADRLVAEKHEFYQDELVELNKVGILPHIIDKLKKNRPFQKNIEHGG